MAAFLTVFVPRTLASSVRKIRRRAQKGAQNVKGKSLPAPTGGWDAVSPIAKMPVDRALVLDNWFPTPTDVRVRRGSTPFCTGLGAGVVDTLMVYNATQEVNSKLFGAANNKIYDASSGTVSTSVSSLNSNRWQYVNFTTAGGHFLWCCNGVDAPHTYDTSGGWLTPSLSVTTFSGNDIINVNAHKKRLWFVFKNSTVAGFLPVASIAGTVSNFDLGAQFTKGGFLVSMGTWTHDSGYGPDDYAVFISSEGQVVVYKGIDPTDATNWSMIGVFDLGPPIGYRCFDKLNSDLALISIDGLLPLSKALGEDRGSAAFLAITKNITAAMNTAAQSYRDNFGWQVQAYPKGTYVLLNIPITEGTQQVQYVMNTLTGAWCRFTGQNANSWVVWKDELYYGSNDGKVYKADTGGTDNGALIDAMGQAAYNYYGTPGQIKQWKAAQPIITSGADLTAAIGLSTDFKDNASLGTPNSASATQAEYDTAIYDTDVYATESSTIADWLSLSGEGYCASLHFRAQKKSASDILMAMNGFNIIYETGLVL